MISFFLFLSVLALTEGFTPMTPRHTNVPKGAGRTLHVANASVMQSDLSSDLSNALDKQFQVFLFEARRSALSADIASTQDQSFLSILEKMQNVSENGSINHTNGDNMGDSHNEELNETIALLRAKIERQQSAPVQDYDQQRRRRRSIRRTSPFRINFDINNLFPSIR